MEFSWQQKDAKAEEEYNKYVYHSKDKHIPTAGQHEWLSKNREYSVGDMDPDTVKYIHEHYPDFKHTTFKQVNLMVQEHLDWLTKNHAYNTNYK